MRRALPGRPGLMVFLVLMACQEPLDPLAELELPERRVVLAPRGPQALPVVRELPERPERASPVLLGLRVRPDLPVLLERPGRRVLMA